MPNFWFYIRIVKWTKIFSFSVNLSRYSSSSWRCEGRLQFFICWWIFHVFILFISTFSTPLGLQAFRPFLGNFQSKRFILPLHSFFSETTEKALVLFFINCTYFPKYPTQTPRQIIHDFMARFPIELNVYEFSSFFKFTKTLAYI